MKLLNESFITAFLPGVAPYHPPMVHVIVGTAMVLPFLILAAIVLIDKYETSPRIWLLIALLHVFLFAGAVGANVTGHVDEEIAEKAVAKELIHDHEELGEVAMYLSGLALFTALAGIKEMTFTRYIRYGSLGISAAVMIGVLYTGKLGGELV